MNGLPKDDPAYGGMYDDEFDQVVRAIQHAETGGLRNPDRAVSPKGAVGAMQIMPSTARQYGISRADLLVPQKNLSLGKRILSENLTRYNNDRRKAAWAYNAGRGAVDAGRMPHETRGYLDRFLGRFSPSEASAAEGLADLPEDDPAYGGTFTRPGTASLPKDDPAYGGSLDRPVTASPRPSGVPSAPMTSTAPLQGPAQTGLFAPAGAAAQATSQIYASPEGRAGAELAASPALGAIGAEAIGAPLEAAGFGRLVTSLGRALGSTLATTDPSQPNAARQAGWSLGLNLLGEAIGLPFGRYGTEAEQAAKATAATGAMTPAKVKSLSQVRQLLQSAGSSPEEIDSALGAAREASGADTRGAYNAVIQNARNQFKNDYSSVFGGIGSQEVDTTAISQKLDELEAEIARRGTEDQESPALKRFFDHQRALLAAPGEYPSEILGAKKGTSGYEKLRQDLIAQGRLKGGTANRQTVVQLQGLRSEIRDLRTASASNTTKWASNELEAATTKLMNDALGPEKAQALGAVDSRYRTFENMREAFGNVNSTAFAHEAANAIFDAGTNKNYESLEHLFTLARQANKVNPEIMPALRGAFLTKLIGDARLADPGNLDAQKQFVAKLTQAFRGRVPETMEALFGKGTPFTDIRQMAKVFGSASMPDTERTISGQLVQLGRKAGRMGAFASSGYFLWRLQYGLLFGTSPWADLEKDPAKFAAGMAISIATGAIAAKVMTHGSVAMQRAWAQAMLHPSENNLNRFFEATAPLAAQGLNQAAMGQGPTVSAPGAVPPATAPAAPAPRLTFKAGERRTKGGKTYERDEAGRWHQVSS